MTYSYITVMMVTASRMCIKKKVLGIFSNMETWKDVIHKILGTLIFIGGYWGQKY